MTNNKKYIYVYVRFQHYAFSLIVIPIHGFVFGIQFWTEDGPQ